jgi:hypothetical protein
VDVRRATELDIAAIQTFWGELDSTDPEFNCLGRVPNDAVLLGYLKEPRAIAIAEDSGIVAVDLFNLDTGYVWITAVLRERFDEAMPALLRHEMEWTGVAPWGPVTTVAMLNRYLALGCVEDENGDVRWAR